ncbi:phage pre-tape measure protein [Candidatus Macondimonas diazotrophica]|jgi:hypothetical protein|uniref:Uncharacterized protein n=1 Tax=Candidatus Macondimonas diazotrophica TaxID=2305248 RepID=A0A4Z0F5X3_9GAMM|nr:hypothetical protein [Candidatus Macondimonas diazotrophica]NCU01989.1 hypothetical protein [Candidatus Macondimonas diazotrophica]TFZ81355.1 hypothetical protein E4680_12915 [Candidatus Macondimonas diazotrophica]
MPGLAGVVVPTRTLRVGESAVVLRGLSFDEIGQLMTEHSGAFDQLEATLSGLPAGGELEVLPQLLRVFPRLAEQAVALAADEPDQADTVRRLGAGFLQEALIAIWELTTEPAGGGKKFIARCVTLFSGARHALPDLAATQSAADPSPPH